MLLKVPAAHADHHPRASKNPMRIATRTIAPDQPPYIIAELGVNHDGSVDRALALVDIARAAGADAVKLQLFETDRLMSKSSKLAAYQRAAGETDPVAMLRRFELSIEQMRPIVDRAHAAGLHAIVTVFSVELVAVAEQLPWDAYKTASPDIIHRPLLDALMATGKPLIVSTGASTLEEVVRAAEWLTPANDRLAILQCVSSYPTSASNACIPALRAIRDAVGEPVGYSDHTQLTESGLCAALCGASILEKHLTYNTAAKGPDHAASLNGEAFRKYVDLIRVWQSGGRNSYRLAPGFLVESPASAGAELAALNALLHGAAAAKTVLPIEQDVRTVSRQSIIATRDLPAGHRITPADLTFKRPGTGIPPCRIAEVLGHKLTRSIQADTTLTERHLDHR